MRSSLLSAGLLSLGLSFFPGLSLAQGLVANELWQAWQEEAHDAGAVLSAKESREGNKLVLRDLRLDTGEDGGVLQVEVVTLTNQADGSVAVVLPETFPLIIETPAAAGAAPGTGEKVVLSVAAPDLHLIVRGIHDRADFEASAPELKVSFDRFIPARPPEEGEGHLAVTLQNPALRYSRDFAQQLRSIDAALSFDALEAAAAVSGRAQGDIVLSLLLAKTEATFAGAFPPSLTADAPDRAQAAPGVTERAPADLLKILADGFRVKSLLQLGGLELKSTQPGAEGEAPVEIDFALAGTRLAFDADQTAAGFELLANGLSLSGNGGLADLPQTETALQIGEYRTAFRLGLNGLRGPQDWSAAFALRGFDVSAGMWQELDPQGAFPREPLTAAVTLEGRYAVLPELLAPEGFSFDKSPLAELSFEIRELALEGVGLQFGGEGGLRFDMADLESWGGIPAPLGKLRFMASGVYGFLDKLSALGRISAEELQGIRAALLVIGKAGDKPDTLRSELEFQDGGLVLNGMKIR